MHGAVKFIGALIVKRVIPGQCYPFFADFFVKMVGRVCLIGAGPSGMSVLHWLEVKRSAGQVGNNKMTIAHAWKMTRILNDK